MAAKKTATAKGEKQADKAHAPKGGAAKAKTPQPPGMEAAEPKNVQALLNRLNAEYAKFESPAARKNEAARARRGIYNYLVPITHALIGEAVHKGNVEAARVLFEFAGLIGVAGAVQDEPKREEARKRETACEAEAPAKPVAPGKDPREAVLSFYKKLGIDPPKLKPPKPAEAPQETSDEFQSAV